MPEPRSNNAAIAAALVFAIFLWGGNNAGTKFVVQSWPPVWTGGTRFFAAGLLLLGLLHWTTWLGRAQSLTAELRRQLWIRGALSLAAYIICFNWALRFTSASHVALYLGASPVWALLWEERPKWNRDSLRRYGAALLALTGVVVLFWPALKNSEGSWPGEVLGLASSVLWTNYGRQCRVLGVRLSGVEASAHTMWRAGVLLIPWGMVEVVRSGLTLRGDLIGVQVYCIVAGGVIAFAIWNTALRHWRASQVLLFNNLIPISTMGWAWIWLKEEATPTFWVAMVLIVTGVTLGQVNWEKALRK